MITSIEALDELLSRPAEADKSALVEMPGDLMILGVAGKMGPTLAMRARRAADEAGVRKRIIGVSRFSERDVRERLESAGVETIAADLLDPRQLRDLPEAPNILYMAGRKFGTAGDQPFTWAMNCFLAGLVAERFRHSRLVAFSSGNVYPLVPVAGGGATEETAPEPQGEYAQSVLGRERLFQYSSARYGIPAVLLRLNYAVELRYGVLLDVGLKVHRREPVDLSMGFANVIWQGDANSVALRSFSLCRSPAAVLNLTGPQTVSIRRLAEQFARRLQSPARFEGQEPATALLNNAARCHRLFGLPAVSLEEMIELTAEWIEGGGVTLDKPTHFEVRDGRY